MNPDISINIITFGRSSIYSLINKLFEQDIDLNYEIIIISEVPLDESKLSDDRIKIYYEPSGKGISYYRNKAILHSTSPIIILLDDDHLPMSNKWLDNLAKPIHDGNEMVTTAGYHIPLGHGYVADSISLLGFPGGGAIGFKDMWHVDNGYTNHITGGNTAISKSLIEDIGGFNESLKFGTEDNYLNCLINERSVKIKYVDDAVILHEPRCSVSSFIKWHIKRGKATYDFKELGRFGGSYVKERMRSFKIIAKRTAFTKYFPMVMFLLFNQYFWNLTGFMKRKYD